MKNVVCEVTPVGVEINGILIKYPKKDVFVSEPSVSSKRSYKKRYPRHLKNWTEEEEAHLVRLIGSRQSWSTISQRLGRKIPSLKQKAYLIAAKSNLRVEA